MNCSKTLVVVVVVLMCGLIIYTTGRQAGEERSIDKRDSNLQTITPKTNDSKSDAGLQFVAYSSERRHKTSHLRVKKKLRLAKRNKFKSRKGNKKAKYRKNMKIKAPGNHTTRNFTKKKPKSLALKRSKIQSKSLLDLTENTRNEKDKENACGECNLQLDCPSFDAMVQYCPSGIVKDKCDCCVQCASSVGMQCYTSVSALNWIAPCGKDLECLPVSMHEFDITQARSVWGTTVSLEGVCSCTQSDAVCSSNEVTYENICEFREAVFRQLMITGFNTSMSHHGPCRSAPKINSKPADVTEKEGTVVSFRCETSGYPLPKVQWIKKGGNIENGRDLDLPGYLNHAVTQIRGGPRKYQLTTWLTLDRVRENDNGVYICRSSNYYGIADAAASLHVTGK